MQSHGVREIFPGVAHVLHKECSGRPNKGVGVLDMWGFEPDQVLPWVMDLSTLIISRSSYLSPLAYSDGPVSALGCPNPPTASAPSKTRTA